MSSGQPGRVRTALDRAAEYMLDATVLERIGIAAAATGAALLIGVFAVIGTGHSPVTFLNELVWGAFGDQRRLSRTLQFMTLYVLAGVAVAVAFRAGVFNIGVQGQLIFGGAACVFAIVSIAPVLPENAIVGVLLIVIGTIAAAIGGGLYGALPGVLKAYYGANEIITTIMLNFIAIGFIGWAIDSGPLRDPDAGTVRTEFLPDHVSPLPSPVFGDSNFSIFVLIFALIVVALTAVLMARTRFGYDMVTSGYQASAATFSGVDAKRTIVATMTLSGMIAGVVGAVLAIMIQGRFIDPGNIHTYGFDAIAVSLLAANNPIGVVPAGLLFGALDAGGSNVQLQTDIPVQLIDGIVGLVVLFVAVPELFRMAANRTGLGGETP